MLDNPVKREVVKGGGASLAALSGDPLAIVLASALGIAGELMGYLGEKRTRELFDKQELLDKVINEVQASDDFASFVYDIWMKHNFESSEQRRKMLKAVLINATQAKDKEFENFTRIISAAQQIDDTQLMVLGIFYSESGQIGSSILEQEGSLGLDGRGTGGFKVNASNFIELLNERGISLGFDDADELIMILNQLCYLGLLGTYMSADGEFYLPTGLGSIFLDYIRS